jgi:AraC family transcriptional activator of pobA
MNPVKIYRQVNRDNHSISFAISRMGDIYKKLKGTLIEPHRHDFYTVLLVKKAKGKHIVDFNEYELGTNQIHFVGPGQVHHVIEEEASSGYAMIFSTEFLLENNIPLSFISDLNLFNNYGQSPPMELNVSQQEQLAVYCEEMITWNQSTLKFQEEAIGALLRLFLIRSNNLCTAPNDYVQNTEVVSPILKKFKELVESHYFKWHRTSEYANGLNITPDHLNRTIKSLIGKTAKEYIQGRIIIAAKRMLYFSELSSKQIGFELGFEESSNFSAFFKKHTTKSPTVFRKKQ